MLRNIILASVSVLALTGVAAAADLHSRKAPEAYASAPLAYSWTGFYVGAQLGYGWAHDTGKSYNAAGVYLAKNTLKMDGPLGGIHAGYNLQSGSLVYGLEADLEAANVRASTGDTALNGGTARLGTQGSLRGRLGYAMNRTLLYVTGGLAVGDNQIRYMRNGLGLVETTNKTHFGWTLGAGVEYALSNNWSARAEYRYTDFGSKTDTLALTYPGFQVKNLVTSQAVRLGLSYKFGGPSAVVAKY